LEERSGKLSAYEFKWNPDAKFRKPITFINAYPEAELKTIHKDNIEVFFTITKKRT